MPWRLSKYSLCRSFVLPPFVFWVPVKFLIIITIIILLIQHSTKRSSVARQTSSSLSEAGKSVRSVSPTSSSTTSELTEKPFHVSGTQRGTASDGFQQNELTSSVSPPSSQKQISIRTYETYFIFFLF